MSIPRCREHLPKRCTRNYVTAVEPFGYPATALVYGSAKCEKPALIWHEDTEKLVFDGGQRVFCAFTATMKVRAK
jgi:hypothetical protein